jgi:alpha-ketoglutarate-dependent taurine dioxygenase
MMEEELRQLLKEHGWNLFTRKRKDKEYYYAQKWRRGEVYISPTSKIEKITEDQVLEKLAKAL